MRFHGHTKNIVPICLAIYGSNSLEFVTEFINANATYTDISGHVFSSSQLAGQYAFEQVKLDRKGYESRRLEKNLSFLADAGAVFSFEAALSHADDLINCYTADFGHDEDGEAMFRIKAQSYRMKKYDCVALWERVKQSRLVVTSVKPGSLSFDDLSEDDSAMDNLSEDILDFTVRFELKDYSSDETFAVLFRYVTADNGQLTVEDLVDFHFTDYPNFHDESLTMLNLMQQKAKTNDVSCLTAVLKFVEAQKLNFYVKPAESFKKDAPIEASSTLVATALFCKNLS